MATGETIADPIQEFRERIGGINLEGDILSLPNIRSYLIREEISDDDKLELAKVSDELADELCWLHAEHLGLEPVDTFAVGVDCQMSNVGLQLEKGLREMTADHRLAPYYDNDLWYRFKYIERRKMPITPTDFVGIAAKARSHRSELAYKNLMNTGQRVVKPNMEDHEVTALTQVLASQLAIHWTHLTCPHKHAILDYWKFHGFEIKDLPETIEAVRTEQPGSPIPSASPYHP